MASGTINGTATVTSGTSAISLRVTWSSAQAVDSLGNPIDNTSTVTASYQMKRNATNFSDSSTFFITINGNRKNDTNGYTYPADNAWHTIMSHSANVTHGTNGTGSTTIQAGGVNSGTSWLTGTVPATSVTLDDFVRLPATPSEPTITRPLSGVTTSIRIASGGSTFYGSTPDYKVQRSLDDSTWYSIDGTLNGETSMGSDGVYDWTTATANSSYYFRTRAYDSEGYSSWSSSTFIAGTPNAPTGLTVAKTSGYPRKRDISWTAPASNNGSTITSYVIEARYSSNGGSTWDTSFTSIGTSTTTSFTTEDLNIAKTYQFRVAAVNSIGTGIYVQTSSPYTFISAYGYRNNGTNFSTSIETAKIYVGIGQPGADAQGWKTAGFLKRWTGDQWIDLQS